MSDLGFLEKLLDGAGVEWVPLGDVTLPTNNIKWRDADRAYRYIDLTSVDIKTKTITETKEITADTAPSRAQKIVKKDDLIFATTRPAQLRYCLIDAEHSGEVASTGYCVLRAKHSEVLPKWILHWIGSREFKEYVEENQSGAAYPAISDGKVKEFRIPIPLPKYPEKSLAIQAEIVRILDAFTELTAELTAELKARKRQYNHYRDQLLSFESDDVEWKALGDLATITIGEFVHKDKQDPAAEYPVFNGGTTHTGFYDQYNNTGNKIIVSARGANAGFVNRTTKPYWAGNSCYSIGVRNDKEVNWEFMYYYLKNSESKLIGGQQRGGIPAVSKKQMEVFQVPVPYPNDPTKSLAEQTKIAKILEKFDTLTTSLSEGLPREIALRQQQYEYYRDLLMSFPKPKNAP